MADRGRDLKFSILSDLSQLETDPAARGLEDVADAAQDAGRRLDALDDDTRKAGDSVERLGKDADKAAAEVDGAFDKIRRASKTTGSQVDDDTRRAGEGFDNLKEEAASTGREAAASFTGSFDDIASGVQEVAANAFAGFGPAGAAAGLLAAAGIGIVVSKIQEARERVKELAGELIDAGGRLDTEGLFARIAEAAKEGDLEKLAKSARTLGIDVTDLSSIFRDSSSANSFLASLDAIGTAQDTVNRVTGRGVDVSALLGKTQDRTTNLTLAQKNALNTLRSAAHDSAEEFAAAEKVARDYEAVTGHSIETIEAYADVINGLTDAQEPLTAAVEDAAKRQAAATKDPKDSWQDYRDTAVASIDDVIARQLAQLTAAENFQVNMQTVLDRAGQAAVDWALSQGDSADEAMALLANAPLAKAQEVAANYLRAGELAGQGYDAGLGAQEGRVVATASQIHSSAARVLGDVITVPIGLDGRYAMSDAARLRYDIANEIGTIVVPVRAGQSPYANTADNSRYR